MAAQVKVYTTVEEYLHFERQAETKSEYCDGKVYAMAGASERHNTIMMNIAAELHQQLKRRPCRVYPSDLRVRVSPTRYYYPDVTVVCGEPELADDVMDILLNPTLVVEVGSPSTAGFDEGVKFAHYRQVASLQEYLMVAQDKPRLVHYVRQADGSWRLTETSDFNATVPLPSIGCALAVADVYAKVEFTAANLGGEEDV